MDGIIRVPDVCERDVDLLLLEEISASEAFRSWFLSQIGISGDLVLIEACRSVKTPNGESDLELTLEVASERVKVLIENKVDATFQPRQPQRYADRARDYGKREKYRAVITVVMAPEVYFGGESANFGFDAKVTYESVLGWLARADHLGERKEYKLALLRGAIERGRLGWKLVPDPKAGSFWECYWRLADQISPQLGMPPPKKEIPAGSTFIRFLPPSLPAGVSLLHKLRYGHVDLQFSGMGSNLADFERRYRAVLHPSMRIEKAGKSAVIRIRVDPLDIASTAFNEAEGVVRKAIVAAAVLLDWYNKVATRTTRA